MKKPPLFQVEYFIEESINQTEVYADLARRRLFPALEGLDQEAKQLQRDEYYRLLSQPSPSEDGDTSGIAEVAQEVASSFYCTAKSLSEGICSLMVAGLFHLFEQQCQQLFTTQLWPPATPPRKMVPILEQLGKLLSAEGISIESFASWPKVEELNLAANVVKHGDGRSATELRQRRPDLFVSKYQQFAGNLELTEQIAPLVGEGLRLSPASLNDYRDALTSFWRELIRALAPILTR